MGEGQLQDEDSHDAAKAGGAGGGAAAAAAGGAARGAGAARAPACEPERVKAEEAAAGAAGDAAAAAPAAPPSEALGAPAACAAAPAGAATLAAAPVAAPRPTVSALPYPARMARHAGCLALIGSEDADESSAPEPSPGLLPDSSAPPTAGTLLIGIQRRDPSVPRPKPRFKTAARPMPSVADAAALCALGVATRELACNAQCTPSTYDARLSAHPLAAGASCGAVPTTLAKAQGGGGDKPAPKRRRKGGANAGAAGPSDGVVPKPGSMSEILRPHAQHGAHAGAKGAAEEGTGGGAGAGHGGHGGLGALQRASLAGVAVAAAPPTLVSDSALALAAHAAELDAAAVGGRRGPRRA